MQKYTYTIINNDEPLVQRKTHKIILIYGLHTHYTNPKYAAFPWRRKIEGKCKSAIEETKGRP